MSRDGASKLRRSIIGCLVTLTLLVQGAESCHFVKQETSDDNGNVRATTVAVGTTVALWFVVRRSRFAEGTYVDSADGHVSAKARRFRTSRTALEGRRKVSGIRACVPFDVSARREARCECRGEGMT